jgi:HSP20 family protein
VIYLLARQLFLFLVKIEKKTKRMEVSKMTLVRYNPDRVLSNVSRDFDTIVDSLFRAPLFKWSADCNFAPRVDIIEDKDSVTLQAEIPGMKKEQIKVMVEDGILTISGERKQEFEKKDKGYLRTERAYGSFSRSFTLPDYVDAEKISADYKDGLLNIALPKTEKAKPKEISVDVK